MEHRIVLRDKSFNILECLEKEALGPSFGWARTGGCGAFGFEVPRKYGEEGFLGGDFDVQIQCYNPVTRVFDLWYSGYIEEKTPSINENGESIAVNGYGYSSQLKRILVDKEYTNTEISLIIKDILDTFVVPNTSIEYDLVDLEDTGFTADKLTFKTTAMEAIQTCADIVGTREWGVDRNRHFFFKARSEVVTKTYPIGGVIADFSSNESFKDIVNSIKIEGGTLGDGTKYTYTKSDAASILKYGLRQDRKSASAITTEDVAERMADAILSEKIELPRKANVTIIGEDYLHESSVPLGLFCLQIPAVRYGEKKYGEFLYSGPVYYQINTIKYSIGEDGLLKKTISLGPKRPTLAESISGLEYELDQLKAANE